MESTTPYGIPQPYTPPDWAKGLTVIPETRIKLAQLPTPIHKWSVPDVPDQFQLYIKRDDLTGAALSGNKVRKLEFIFSQVLEQGCDIVITGGSLQSNHARATAMVARELGIDAHLLLFKKDENESTDNPTGNFLMDCLIGATVGVISDFNVDTGFEYYTKAFKDVFQTLTQAGRKPYIIAPGGASAIGCWGYIEAFREIIEQGVLENFDDIVVSMGAGGTAFGLGVANYLTGSKLKIHGISIGMQIEVHTQYMDQEIIELGLVGSDGQPVKSSNLIDMSYHAYPCYGKVNSEHLKLMTDISTQNGIFLDSTFTVKPFQYMLSMMKESPERFKGNRVLFLHTGGIFGLTGLDETLVSNDHTNRIHSIQEFVSAV